MVAWLTDLGMLMEAAAASPSAAAQSQLWAFLMSLHEILGSGTEFVAATVQAICALSFRMFWMLDDASWRAIATFIMNNAVMHKSWPAELKKFVGLICETIHTPDDLWGTDSPDDLVHGAMLGQEIDVAVADMFGQCAENQASNEVLRHIQAEIRQGYRLIGADLGWYSTIKGMKRKNEQNFVLHLPLCPLCFARFEGQQVQLLQ